MHTNPHKMRIKQHKLELNNARINQYELQKIIYQDKRAQEFRESITGTYIYL